MLVYAPLTMSCVHGSVKYEAQALNMFCNMQILLFQNGLMFFNHFHFGVQRGLFLGKPEQIPE